MAPETSLSCSCCVSPRVRSHRRFRSRGADYVREYGMNWMSVSTKRQCNRALVSPSISSTTLGLRLASPVVCRASTPPLPTSASTALECACVLHQCSEEEGISRYAPFAVCITSTLYKQRRKQPTQIGAGVRLHAAQLDALPDEERRALRPPQLRLPWGVGTRHCRPI